MLLRCLCWPIWAEAARLLMCSTRSALRMSHPGHTSSKGGGGVQDAQARNGVLLLPHKQGKQRCKDSDTVFTVELPRNGRELSAQACVYGHFDLGLPTNAYNLPETRLAMIHSGTDTANFVFCGWMQFPRTEFAPFTCLNVLACKNAPSKELIRIE